QRNLKAESLGKWLNRGIETEMLFVERREPHTFATSPEPDRSRHSRTAHLARGERESEPIASRPFVEDRKATKLCCPRRRLSKFWPATASRHQKEIAGFTPEQRRRELWPKVGDGVNR
ncbi:MAG TPA: hypothetical protein VED87_03165, partial [Methylocystis sp.]|nr:hypothetical protein [Methylocystis sp.]